MVAAEHQHSFGDLAAETVELMRKKAPVLIDLLTRTMNEMRAFRRGEAHLCLQLSRPPGVVGIEEREPLAAGHSGSMVSCRGDALVCLSNGRDPRAKGLDDRPGLIGGAIVNHDDFRCNHRLCEHTFDRLAKSKVPA